MGAESSIEWTDATWNPVTGCKKVSAGCKHCYAETFAERWRGIPGHPYEQGFDLKLWPERLSLPLRWTKPRRIFVNSMSDLFHEDVPYEFIRKVFHVMQEARQHTFQVLTKRAERAHRFSSKLPWPENVWLGVSCENQELADERIPFLLETPAFVRWISAEPLLGPIDLGQNTATCDCCPRWRSRWVRLHRPVGPDLPFPLGSTMVADAGIHCAQSNRHGALSVTVLGDRQLGIKPDEFNDLPRLDWVVVGGESGPGARPMDPEWAQGIRDQCVAAGVPFFFKQWGGVQKALHGRELDGRTWDEYPHVSQIHA